MFYKKKGLPEESELVVCTVKRVLPHSVFCTLEEYDRLEGMIHISEISPGRIRNIRDYVKEDKRIVCKILRIDEKRNHIDLSLRRVSATLRKKKNSEYKQEQKAEKILNTVARNLKTELKDVYVKAGYKLIDEFESLNEAFQSIVTEELDLKKLGVEDKYAKEITNIVKEKIKPPEVTISGTLNLSSNEPEGLKIIKKSIVKALDFAKKHKYDLSIRYLSAPRYRVDLKASDYKSAEKQLEEISKEVVDFMEKNNGNGSFSRK